MPGNCRFSGWSLRSLHLFSDRVGVSLSSIALSRMAVLGICQRYSNFRADSFIEHLRILGTVIPWRSMATLEVIFSWSYSVANCFTEVCGAVLAFLTTRYYDPSYGRRGLWGCPWRPGLQKWWELSSWTKGANIMLIVGVIDTFAWVGQNILGL